MEINVIIKRIIFNIGTGLSSSTQEVKSLKNWWILNYKIAAKITKADDLLFGIIIPITRVPNTRLTVIEMNLSGAI